VALTGSAILGLLLALVVAGASGPIATFFKEPRVRPILAVISITFVCRGLESTPNDMLRRSLRFREFVISSTIATVLAGAVGVVLAFMNAGVWALVGSALTEAFLAATLAWVLAIRAGVWRPGFGLDRSAFHDLIGYSAIVTAQRVLSWGNLNLDNAIVGKVFGARQLGFYGLAYRVMLFPIQKIADTMSTIAFPAFAHVQRDIPKLRKGFIRGMRYVSLVCFPLTIGIAVTAPVLVPVVFGSRWVPAVVPLQILALNGPRIAIIRLNGSVYQAIGKPGWDFWTTAFGLGLSAPAFLIGANWGIEGVAWGFTIAGLLRLPVSLWLVAKGIESSVGRLLRSVTPMTAATVFMAAAALATRLAIRDSTSDTVQLVAMVAVGAVVYVLAIKRMAPGLLPHARADFVRRGT